MSPTVTVTLVSGSPGTVSLSYSGTPNYARITFNPSSGTPTFSSTMNIQTGYNGATPKGTYSITITASGGGKTRTCTYTLTVT